jgi:hypothetical protein
VGGVALTGGDPVGPPGDLVAGLEVLDALADFDDDAGEVGALRFASEKDERGRARHTCR